MDQFRTSPNRSELVLNQFGKWIDKKPRKKTALGWICSPSDYCYYTLVHLSGLTLGAGPVLVLEPLSWVSDRSRSGGSEVNEPGATNRKVGGGAPVTMATLTWVPIGPPGGATSCLELTRAALASLGRTATLQVAGKISK